MKLRLASRVMVVALVVMVGGIMLLRGHLADGQVQTRLQGADLGGTAAPAFALRDQNGAEVSLASLRGHPVVLAFMYTHCPDECPLTASKLHTVAQALGAKAQEVRWVAISTDPLGDTASTAQAFVRQHQVDGYMHYLLGDEAQLAPIWQAYHVAVEPATTATSGGHSAGDGRVTHTGGLYVLDGQGRERVYLDPNFAPGTLEGDLRALL
jgi:protein SCO1/2